MVSSFIRVSYLEIETIIFLTAKFQPRIRRSREVFAITTTHEQTCVARNGSLDLLQLQRLQIFFDKCLFKEEKDM